VNNLLGSKTAGSHTLSVAAAVTLTGSGDSTTKLGAGDRTFNSFGPAGAVALSGASGHVKRSHRGSV
jgi:hypothetical protein